MDSCLDGNNIEHSNNRRPGKSIKNRVFNGSGLIWIIAIGFALLLSNMPAFGQFTVQPMKLELAVTPGKIVKSILRVQSFDPDETHTINMSVVELSQLEDGAWNIIEPNEINDPNSPNFGFDLSRLSSCSDWISMSPSSFPITPNEVVPVEVSIRVRRGIQGFFGAGILASISPIRGMGDVSVVVRFFVPVILEIQNRPVRPNVQATDIGMEFFETTDTTGQYQARSMVSMDIENNGGSYSRVKPAVRIWSFTDGHWRVITTTELPECGIIPGVKLKLKADIRKSLPSGKYKAAGILYVDGRRKKKIEKEIDFVGDSKITNVGADAPLDLEPIDVTIDGLPGATRTATLKVYNASKETVNVRTALGLSSILQIGTFDNVKGEDLDCTQWVKVTPEQFTLRGEGGLQTLRVVATMPKDLPLPYPTYFSLLALHATYPDGQNAGYTTTNICLRNAEIDAQPAAVATKVIPQTLGDSKYLVVAKFGNYGLVQFVPIRVKAALIMPLTGISRVSTFLYGNPNLMLPFEERDYSGVLDLTYVSADVYRLAAAIEYAPGVWADKQMSVRVSIEGDKRIVEVLGVQEELTELIKVNW